ncbi:MAG: RNA-binding S4 domain-containing protein [Acidobacteria bacterium]|nr:RNA-binding S4 domain-containing protein [Acidobacteriota bacterium]
MEGVRIDKWLWAARFYKTRSQAADACNLGRIECRGVAVKASREVKPGDMLLIRKGGGDFHVEVLALSLMRGPAAVAQTLYRETEESKAMRLKRAEERKMMAPFEISWQEGKPSKKDRRDIDKLRGRTF